MGGGFFLLTFALPPRVHRQSTIRHEAITGDIAFFRADAEQRHRHNVLVEIPHARAWAGCDFGQPLVERGLEAFRAPHGTKLLERNAFLLPFTPGGAGPRSVRLPRPLFGAT